MRVITTVNLMFGQLGTDRASSTHREQVKSQKAEFGQEGVGLRFSLREP